jgi:uncharacterized protein (TIGR00369 family)
MSSDTTTTPLYPVETLRRLMEELPHCKELGLHAIDIQPGSCLLKLDYAEQLIGNIETGLVHGGVITTLLDSAGGVAAFSVVPQGNSVATLDLRIDYLTQAKPGQAIYGLAESYRKTRHVIFVRGYAYHESPDAPIANFTASFMVGSVGFAPDAH